uniref:Major facilitator superfamily domain-containing protein 3-like n=1 Tax=Dermatophagoides pteronyssinus TaxID=6956 RepID=A0A6P6Y632_DERPT|nr:major facilitator superfamily domain-containing protein 3-like [Dermatophagoides pteronyssinus]
MTMVVTTTATITSKNLSSTECTIILGLLYFIQGFPYGFQDKLIPLLLIIKGHSPSTIGFIRLLLLPWLTKALFAPLIDMTLSMTKWIQISLFGLIMISAYNTIFPDTTVNDDSNGEITWQFIIALFLLNFFSAFQDIAVDAIAVTIYSKHRDIMTGNAGQIVGYKLGAFFGSGILFWIYNLFNWNGLFAVLTIIYTIVLFIFQTYSKRLSINSIDNVDDNVDNDDQMTATNKKRRNQMIKYRNPKAISSLNDQQQKSKIDKDNRETTTTLPLISIYIFIFVYKLGESGSMAIYPLFLTKFNTITSQSLAFWNGTIGIICSIFGSLLASRLSISISNNTEKKLWKNFFKIQPTRNLKNYRLNKLIKFRLLPLCLKLIIFSTTTETTTTETISSSFLNFVSIISMLLLHFIGGLITTMTFTLMMITCQQQQQQQMSRKSSSSLRATHYTLMSTIEVFGKLLLSSLSGLIVDNIGFIGAQSLFILLAILPCTILHYHHHHGTK